MNKQEYNELNLITSYVTTQTVHEDSMDRCEFIRLRFLIAAFKHHNINKHSLVKKNVNVYYKQRTLIQASNAKI